jgi:glutamate-1-semialdehyde 2,1-aminomutase
VWSLSHKYLSRTKKSKQLHERAKRVLPAGVSYFVRYIEPYPFYTVKAKGSKLYDVDGNTYIDFWNGHYSLILGHSHPRVVRQVKRQLDQGTHYGTAHELEIALAEQVKRMVPGVEMTRFSSSGTEAMMYATRLARAVTGRSQIGKFEGGWHGGYDALHVAVRPPFDLPESNGLTPGSVQDTVILPYNNTEGVREAIKRNRLAAVFVESLLGSGGCIPAQRDFLRELRELCSENGTLLIFDEVITGFRLAPGGASEFFGVEPDIRVFGKVLGGGFPIGAIAASREIMDHMNPLAYPRPKFSFHGGTFTGNPVTMTAGLEVLKILQDGSVTSQLNKKGDKVRRRLEDVFARKGLDVQVTGAGSLWHTHFTREKIVDSKDAARADKEKLKKYHMHLIENGVFFLPGKTGALSTAHTQDDLDKLISETEKFKPTA